MPLPFRWTDLPLLAGATYGAWASFLANAHYLSLAALDPRAEHQPSSTAGELPSPWNGEGQGVRSTVSIVIPARNEALNLPVLLRALGPYVRGEGPVLETIVVDDASSDGTGTIARAHGARVVRLEEGDRPAGWLGKPHACQRGAEAASGEWLLFLDADTAPHPAAIRRAVEHALAYRLDALSLLLRQRCESFWERLLLPFAYQQFFAGVDPARLRDPATAEAFLNGQFILVRARAYRKIGGHGAVKGSIVEDVALARALKSSGHAIETLRGEAFGSVRMYRDLASVRQGFGKNAYAFLADEPARGVRVAASTMCSSAAGPLLGLALIARGRRRVALLMSALLTWLALAAALAPWARRFGVPLPYALLQPFSALVFSAIAQESTLRSVTGLGLVWKGRTYT